MNLEQLSKDLFFSKEAADYLGISIQRLNKLVNDGKLKPIKKSSSGMIFHIDELNNRKKELDIFKYINKEGKKMFEINTRTRQEALNYSTLMGILLISEKKLNEEFDRFSFLYDIYKPINQNVKEYSKFFNIDEKVLLREYEKAKEAFSHLRTTDEIIKIDDDEYPPLLAKTEQAPRFIYIRGNKSLLYEKRTVALVGSREASEFAKDKTKELAFDLGKNGITVVSGLAKGIDVEAHKATLEHNYNTIAVIGTNLNQYYPLQNESVQKEIEKKGLIVSQFAPNLVTQRWFFPLRNGVMSGLSLATIIMEAGETSGALKQADFALKQNRQIIIPKHVLDNKNITWPKKYVEKGACVVKDINDIINELAKSNIFIKDNKKENGIEAKDNNIVAKEALCV